LAISQYSVIRNVNEEDAVLNFERRDAGTRKDEIAFMMHDEPHLEHMYYKRDGLWTVQEGSAVLC